MKHYLEIVSQGEEVITGQVIDTNAAWLAQQAVQLGFTMSRHNSVGDKLNDLILLLNEIAPRADCCLCTGGLGPTCDDLTTEAVALAFNLPLLFDAVAFAHMERLFQQRHKAMPANNRKQALLPQGAIRINNDWGTAAGFALYQERCLFVFLPGVPTEMQAMFSASVLPLLTQRFILQPQALISIKTIALGESAIAELLNTIIIPADVTLGFRATSDTVETKLLFPAGYDNRAISNLTQTISAVLGDYVFAIDNSWENNSDLFGVIDSFMLKNNYSLAVIETVSRGLLAARCCQASWLFSAEYQQNYHSLALLTADELFISAKNLAHALQLKTHADIVLIQLYTGANTSLQDNKQTIILHTLLLARGHYYQAQHHLLGTAPREQNQAALLSLDVLRRYLQGCLICL